MAGSKTNFANYRVLVMALVFIILVLMIYLVFSQFSALKSARKAALGEQVAIDQIRTHLQDLQTLKKQEPVMHNRLSLLKQLLPAQPEESTLISDFDRAADRSDTHFMQIGFEKRISNQDYVEMPFTIEFEGRYQSLLDLLANLQTGKRAVRIDEVNVSRDLEGLSRIRAEISASAFYTKAK